MVHRRLQVKVPNKKKKRAATEKKQEDPGQCASPGVRDTKDYDRATKGVDESNVVILTDSNFDKQVMDSNKMWLVEFYAPWCSHC